MKREYRDILNNISRLNGFVKAKLDAIYADILPDSPKPRSSVLTAYKIAYELQRRVEGGIESGESDETEKISQW